MANSTRLLRYAGEHHALSQFSLAGKYAARMPDCWQGYDLAVETGSELVRVSVKTRGESAGFRNKTLFYWDDRRVCDWFVFVFKPIKGPVRSWIVPSEFVEASSSKPRPLLEDPWFRDISLKKLNDPPLADYEDNWSMEVKELAPFATESSC